MALIDLSASIEPSPEEVPEPLRVDVRYDDHAAGAAQIEALFGVPARLLRDGEGWATEEFTRFGTHSSTHVDAPWHYNSTIRGELAQTIDQLPLEWFFADAVKLTMPGRADGQVIGAAEVEAELERIGHELQPLDIVLVRSGAVYGTDNFIDQGVGLGAEATLWLTERGVEVVGTDAWSWDAPFSHTARRWAETRDPAIIWEGHKAGRIRPYWQIEKLTNLAALPPFGFTLSCFPVKIERASAGWIRAVALVED